MKNLLSNLVSALAMLCLISQSALARPDPATNAPAANQAKPAPRPSMERRGSPRKVDVDQFEKLWQNKTNVVLDVRTQKEFAAGHIPGALNLDVNAPDFGEKASALDKKAVYLVHCAAGMRSARACEKMRGMGFEHLIDLAPGFKGWEKAGKPVQK